MSEVSNATEIATRIRDWLGKYGRENTASLLLYEAMKALQAEGTSGHRAAQATPVAKGDALEVAANRACRHLPDGWSIEIQLERGAGWTEMHTDYGGAVVVDCEDRTLSEQVHAAIDIAIARHEGRTP